MNEDVKKIYPIPSDAILTYEKDIYNIAIYDPDIPYDDLDQDCAYIKGQYFYLLKGISTNPNKDGMTFLEPGVYKKEDGSTLLIEVSTNAEKRLYDVYDAIVKYDKESMVKVLKEKDKLFIQSGYSSGKVYKPSVTSKDDLLKRGIKEALRLKNLDLNVLVDRFPNKNALINFKQGLNNDDRPLSILLFERGAEALNLKYTIIIEDLDNGECVGDPIANPIIVSSEDISNAMIDK